MVISGILYEEFLAFNMKIGYNDIEFVPFFVY